MASNARLKWPNSMCMKFASVMAFRGELTLPAECTSISSLTRGKYLYKYAQVLAFWLNHKWSAVALTIQGGKKVPYLARNDFARDACRRHQGWNDMCAFRSNCWRSVWILIGKESWGDIGIISAGDHTPIAIGSGTCVSRGIAGRLAAYENGLDSRHVPRHVWRAFQQMILSFFCGDIIETTSFSDPALSVVGDENGDGEHCSIAIHSD